MSVGLSAASLMVTALVLAPAAGVRAGGMADMADPGTSVRGGEDSNDEGRSALPAGVTAALARVRADSRKAQEGDRAALVRSRARPAWRAEGNQASAWFGISVATAGDVNGDGYDDVIVGAWYYDNGQSDEGRAFVYYGSALGLSATPNWTAESDQVGALFGVSVATAGDVNGDGYDDVIIGATGYDRGQSDTDEGRAFAYYGSALGLSASPNWTAEGDQVEAHFGTSVATAGDVNGDGYDDVIVGAPYYSLLKFREGRTFAYYGSASGLSATPNWTAEIDQGSAFFGVSVATAGDLNGDGYDDVIVGAYFYDHGETDEGAAVAYYGSVSGLSATPIRMAEGNQASASFGDSVATAGDVNGDGYDDVIVGAYLYDHGETDEGAAVVFQGRATMATPR